MIRQSTEFVSLFLSRMPIEEALKKPDLSNQAKEKLQLTAVIKDYAAQKLNLVNNDDFTKVIFLPREVYVHLLFVADPKIFKLHHWWYPIMGNFSYRGFFELDEAKSEVKKYQDEGFETHLSQASSFSGANYISTPLTSNLFDYDWAEYVDLIFHELAHATLFVKGNTDFNEAYAVFMGNRGSEFFLQDSEILQKYPQFQGEWQKAQENRNRRKAFITIMESLQNELKKDVYQTSPANLSKRSEIFKRYEENYSSQFAFFKKPLNNARILAVSLYNPDLEPFAKMLETCQNNWQCFQTEMKKVNPDTLWQDSPSKKKNN